jgi:hypothetical protein
MTFGARCHCTPSAERFEVLGLFTPAPTQIRGQLGLGEKTQQDRAREVAASGPMAREE